PRSNPELLGSLGDADPADEVQRRGGLVAVCVEPCRGVDPGAAAEAAALLLAGPGEDPGGVLAVGLGAGERLVQARGGDPAAGAHLPGLGGLPLLPAVREAQLRVHGIGGAGRGSTPVPISAAVGG